MMCMSLEQEIKDQALALGFDAVGITDTSPIPAEHVEHFERWLRSGCAGRMEYMHRHLEKRLHPARLCEDAESVVVVALNYRPLRMIADGGPGSKSGVTTWRMADSILHSPPEPFGRVALYAQYEDYHLFIKALLRELAAFISLRTCRQDRFRVCVDSAPLAEKALAARAGLGCIGRNHLLIHPQLGPQILLGELLTSVPLQPDRPVEGGCLGCNRCVKACPTGALRPDGLLDAARCISYLTQYGPEDALVGSAGDWLFGCDECLSACPLQEKAPVCANRRFRFYRERARLSLPDVLELTPETFGARFHDSPLRRLGLERFKHNARKCLESQISNSKKI
jgi:epoxyqueuosine reductase